MKSLQSKALQSCFLALLLAISCQTSDNTVNQSFAVNSHPTWAESAVLYEVNVRQFTETGTFNAFSKELPRLQDLGVDILWFMPIHPIGEKERKGSLGSYYAVKDYTATNPEFGSLEDFKSLVDKAHNMGFKVIIDWVANHTAPDHNWVSSNPDFYELNEEGEIFGPFDWSDVAQLDFDNKALWEAMTADMKFWLEEVNIDGFRCDVAGLVPVAFWEYAKQELIEAKDDIWMLAENEDVPALMNTAFDANYGWGIHAMSNQIVKKEKNAADLVRLIKSQEAQFPNNSYAIQFTTNHDENSWNGSVYERYGDAYNTMNSLMYVLPGMPLIYSGQESGTDHRLEFFEKDPIKWNNYAMQSYFKQLNEMKHSIKALNVGPNAGSFDIIPTSDTTNVLSFHRKNGDSEVFGLFNLSANETTTSTNWPNRPPHFDSRTNQEAFPFNEAKTLTLAAWEYHIWYKK
jgi:glycosidase